MLTKRFQFNFFNLSSERKKASKRYLYGKPMNISKVKILKATYNSRYLALEKRLGRKLTYSEAKALHDNVLKNHRTIYRQALRSNKKQ